VTLIVTLIAHFSLPSLANYWKLFFGEPLVECI